MAANEVIPDFIPDSKFVPDQTAGAQTSDFIPDDQFVSDDDKYGSPGQMAVSALEGFGRGATFGVSTGIEKALGVKPEDIAAREKVNPGSALLGEAASFIIPGAPEAELLGKAGAGAARLAGLAEAVSPIAKVGSSAVKMATETALAQSGNEVHKMFVGDPDQSVGTAISDIGLSGLIGGAGGGALGLVNPLWAATGGPKLEAWLVGPIKKVLNGEAAPLTEKAELAAGRLGKQIPAELRPGMMGSPEINKQFNILRESATSSGLKLQKSLDDFHDDLEHEVFNIIGKTPEEIKAYSPSTSGREAQDTFKEELLNKYGPIAQRYEKYGEKFKNIPINSSQTYGANIGYGEPTRLTSQLADKIAEVGLKTGAASENGLGNQLYDFVSKEIPKQNTVEDLKNLITKIGDRVKADYSLSHVGRELREAVLNIQDEAMSAAMSEGERAEYSSLRGSYKDLMNIKDRASQELSLGKSGGTKEFLNKLEQKKSPEMFLKALSPKNNAEVVPWLAEHFPQTLEKIKQSELASAMKPFVSRAPKGKEISTEALRKALDSMTPEYRKLILSEEQLQKLGDLNTLRSEIAPYQSSRTAYHLEAKNSHMLSTAMSAVAALTGHGFLSGLLLGEGAKVLGRDIPDALRLGLLKFIGSENPVEAEGFKSMVDFIHHTIKGENKLSKATQSIFKAGALVMPRTMMPSERDREKLDKRLEAMQVDPNHMLNVGGKTGYYLPDHGMELSKTAMNATNYLNSLRPVVQKKSPFDTDLKPSQAQKAKYDIALDIAQQPLMVMDSIKNGTLTPFELSVFKNLYPGLYKRTSQKLMHGIMEHTSKGLNVPYRTRMNLSLFLGQPLDSTMMPKSIIAAQATNVSSEQPSQSQPQQPKGSLKSLNKFAASAQTGAQASEQRRLKA